MKKEDQFNSENDLLQLPDIDGLVMDIKQQETMKNVSADPAKKDFWSLFLQCSGQYEYRKKLNGRRAVLVDIEIINTFKDCDINKMSVATIVNSVMRAFIAQYQDTLREHTIRKGSLI